MDLVDKQKARLEQDNRTELINALYLMDLDTTHDGRKFEDVSTYTLYNTLIRERCIRAEEI